MFADWDDGGDAFAHPEAVVEEAVDDGVDEAVGHGEPVDRVVDGGEEALLVDRLILEQVRLEVDDEREDVQRQPADTEAEHHHRQHLDYLKEADDIAIRSRLGIGVTVGRSEHQNTIISEQ